MKSFVLGVLKIVGILFVLVTALVGYNLLRHHVFWSPASEVSFNSSDGTEIVGSLVKPADDGVFPAIVILHGAGPENIGAIDYRALVNNFVRHGFAVLLYDKRGVNKSGGDFSAALYSDFVEDAIAAVRFLAARPDIDSSNIGLLGISEGAWFAPEIAYRTDQVAFIVNKVGSPFSWVDTVIWEVESDLLAAGLTASEIEPFLDLTYRRWQYYIDAGRDPQLATGERRDAIEAEMQRLNALHPSAVYAVPASLPPYDMGTYGRYAANYSYDTGQFLTKIDVPMLYLYGTEDINIPTARCVPFLEAFREEHGRDIDIEVYEGMGHGLVTWRGALNAGYVPGYLERIGEWSVSKVVR